MAKSHYTLVLDTTLWNAFKAKCASQGRSMLSVIVELVTKFVGE